MDAQADYSVEPTSKVGEELGEIKNGGVTMISGRLKGKELKPTSGSIMYEWRVYDKWYPCYRNRY